MRIVELNQKQEDKDQNGSKSGSEMKNEEIKEVKKNRIRRQKIEVKNNRIRRQKIKQNEEVANISS